MLKRILHDWDDEQCVAILRTCRHALASGGRLLVIDAVIQRGNDPHRAKDLDLLLMAAFPGRERTRAEVVAELECACIAADGSPRAGHFGGEPHGHERAARQAAGKRRTTRPPGVVRQVRGWRGCVGASR